METKWEAQREGRQRGNDIDKEEECKRGKLKEGGGKAGEEGKRRRKEAAEGSAQSQGLNMHWHTLERAA